MPRCRSLLSTVTVTFQQSLLPLNCTSVVCDIGIVSPSEWLVVIQLSYCMMQKEQRCAQIWHVHLELYTYL